jgi:hypothetical protein
VGGIGGAITPRLRFHADPGIKDAFVLNQKIDALTRNEE